MVYVWFLKHYKISRVKGNKTLLTKLLSSAYLSKIPATMLFIPFWRLGVLPNSCQPSSRVMKSALSVRYLRRLRMTRFDVGSCAVLFQVNLLNEKVNVQINTQVGISSTMSISGEFWSTSNASSATPSSNLAITSCKRLEMSRYTR